MATMPPAARKVLRFWEWPFLAALAGFMLWVRWMPYNALVGGERAYFIGTDPFYHYRATLGIVRAFPFAPRWDPWTYYPYGTGAGQFSSLFDWAAAAFIVATQGKGASEQYVGQVLGAYPAVLGALLIVPFYFLAKRLLGTPGAVVASVTLAVLPGEFLIRSLAGYSDHHVAEALMVCVSMLGVYVAATRGHRAREALENWRDTRGYAKPLAFALLGGVALWLNYLVWPPALLFTAILTAWLTIVILLEDGRSGGNGIGYAFGGAVSFAVSGLLMVPFLDSTFLGEFNTYSLLHVIASLGAGAWVLVVHFASRWTRARALSPWAVPAGIGALGLVGFLVLKSMDAVYGSILWGLSWVTGIGVKRTTMTIAEARPSDFFCSGDTATASCLSSDFGLVAPVSFLILLGLLGWTIFRRRPADILLLLWSLMAFRATATQIRFSYYLAINMALLVGWLAARVAASVGVDDDERAPVAPAAPKGRRAKQVVAASQRSRPLQVAAVAAVALIVMPGNVFATDDTVPAWKAARINAADGDLAMWMDGLDWMRHNTPDAGVDLGLVLERPAPGERYQYPEESYGVLSWWDYGHWIQTTALRPPVANPFQQAAPFASTWFTERDPAQAEKLLHDWVGDAGPVRYVFIDDEMATGKYGAITVWANNQNESRARWAGGDYISAQNYRMPDGSMKQIRTVGPEYRDSMMGRLYDADANGLSHYRLVWEHPHYSAIGSVANANGELRCLHDVIPSRGCPIGIASEAVTGYQEGTVVHLGEDAYAYDLFAGSRLKLFERVPGATLTGETAPGATVVASVQLAVKHDATARPFQHTVRATADESGRFQLVFPYATTQFLAPDEGGTNSIVQVQGPVLVTAGAQQTLVDVPDRAVLQGETVPVSFG